MDSVKVFLLYPLHATSCNKMILIAQAIESQGHKVFWLIDSRKTRKILSDITDTSKWDVREYEESRFFGKFRYVLKSLSLRITLYFYERYKLLLHDRWQSYLMVREYRQKEAVMNELLSGRCVDALLIAGDRHLGYEAAVLKVAKKLNIPTFIPPISITLNPKDRARRRIVKNEKYLNYDQDLHLKVPNQFIVNEEMNQVGFYFSWQIRALMSLGMLPCKPWILGASSSDFLMVRGEFEKQELIQYGVSPEKLIITGDPDYDALHKNLEYAPSDWNDICLRYNFDTGKPLILISLPQTFEHKILSLDDHNALIVNICDGATKQGVNVLISLHPKMDYARYKHLESTYPLKISHEPLRDVLVFADVFIASQGSSTLLWSVLCTIPGIICDWFGLEYPPFYWQKGLDVVNDSSDFYEVLKKLIDDKDYYQEQKKSQKNAVHELVLFDGCAMQRIIDAIVLHR